MVLFSQQSSIIRRFNLSCNLFYENVEKCEWALVLDSASDVLYHYNRVVDPKRPGYNPMDIDVHACGDQMADITNILAWMPWVSVADLTKWRTIKSCLLERGVTNHERIVILTVLFRDKLEMAYKESSL
jgi:hypothetical protein